MIRTLLFREIGKTILPYLRVKISCRITNSSVNSGQNYANRQIKIFFGSPQRVDKINDYQKTKKKIFSPNSYTLKSCHKVLTAATRT